MSTQPYTRFRSTERDMAMSYPPAWTWQQIERGISQARYEGHAKQLGMKPVFHLPNRTMAEYQRKATIIAHTNVWWIDADKCFAMIFWYRRDSITVMYEAIAALSMMTDLPIALFRSFTTGFQRELRK